MTNVVGVIESISSKPVSTKYGEKATYSVKVDGEWYKCGFKKPTLREGEAVSFSYSESKYGKEIDMTSFVSATAPATPAAPGSAVVPKSTSYSSRPFPIPPLHGDRAIVRQNSLTNSVNLLKDMLTAEKKMTAAEKVEQVIKVARAFEAYSCGDLDMLRAKEMKEEKHPTTAPDVVKAAETPFDL